MQLAKSNRRSSTTSSRTSPSSPHEDRNYNRDRWDRRNNRDGHHYPRVRYPVIVNNIGRGICWQELKDFGRLAGDVVFCDLDKSKRGRGFIEYLDQESADRAVRDLDGREMNGCVVSVRSYGSHEHRREYRHRSPSPASRTSERYSRDQRYDHHESGYRRFHNRDAGSNNSYSFENRTQMPYDRIDHGEQYAYRVDNAQAFYAEQPKEYPGNQNQQFPSSDVGNYSWSGFGSAAHDSTLSRDVTSTQQGSYPSAQPVVDEWSHPDNFWHTSQYDAAILQPMNYGVTQRN